MFEKGESYKEFDVLDTFPVSDYHSVVVHFRHRKTGLEVVHLQNNDEENLFTFAFRTPNEESNGAAHILEHSVLCGSQKFPLKDPFVVLSNQSVKTFLNALTYPDRTVYPASSTIKVDYFSLMRVYGDAVFFPRLDDEIFMQEAHRLELDEAGNASIQGVVYNEMKGDYSSFENAVASMCDKSLLPNSVYEKDSGGDPLVIPSITVEKLRDFHKKWYRPDNCLVFLYGNIPSSEQLDFLQSEFISRLEKKYPSIDVSQKARKKHLDEFLKLVTPSEIKSPLFVRSEGPAADGEGEEEYGNTVVMNWSFGAVFDAEEAAETAVVTTLLLNHDGSPLQKVLLDSKMGEDIAPQTGFSNYLYHSMFSIGLRGVKDGDENKVGDLILETLSGLVQNGIRAEDVEGALLALEFSQRSIKRLNGPYSKTLMGKIVSGWLYGFPLSRQIRSRAVLSKIREKITSQPHFLSQKIRTLLLENPRRSLVVAVPSKKYVLNRKKAEEALCARLLFEKGAETVRSENARLLDFQKKSEDVSIIPHLNPKDFFVNGKPVLPRVKTELREIENGIPLFLNRELTNGITYVCVGFPLDVLCAADYPFIPLLSDAASDMGFVQKDGTRVDWAKASEIVALNAGDFGCAHITTDVSPTFDKTKSNEEKLVGRDWFVYRIAFIEEKTEDAMKVLSDFISGADFSDTKRLLDIVNESRNIMDSSVIPDGHRFAEMRSKCASCHSSAVDELWNGLRQLAFLHSLKTESDEELVSLSKKLSTLHDSILSSGAFIQIIGEESGIESIKSILPKFISNAKIRPLSNKIKKSEADFVDLTRFPEETSADADEVFVTSAQVGFSAVYFPADCVGTKENAVQSVCAHWLSNNLLWEEIRTVGGAYGAFSSLDSIPGGFSLSTYRDPSPFSSIKVFEKCLKKAAEIALSQEEVESAVVGEYSHWIQPQTPRSKAASALLRILLGLTDDVREKKLSRLLKTNATDVKSEFKHIHSLFLEKEKAAIDFKKKSVVICGETQMHGASAGSVKIILPI